MMLLLQLLAQAAATAALAAGAAQSAPAPAPVPPTQPAAALPLTAETFAQLPGIAAPRLSPDGKRIAAEISRNGQLMLAVAGVDDNKIKLIGEGPLDVNWWHWVNNEWLVIGAGQLIPFQGDPVYVSRAFGVNGETAKIVPLAQDAAQDASDILWYAQDGSPRVLLAYQRSIYEGEEFWPVVDEVDVSTGRKSRRVESHSGVMNWYADANGYVRMGVGHGDEGRTTQLLYRKPGNQIFRTVATSSGGKDPIVPALFLDDPNKALVFDEDEKGFSALYEFDLNTLQRGRQIAATPGYDLGGLETDERGSNYAGIVTEETHRAVRWTDPDMKALDEEIAATVKGGATSLVSVDRAHQNAIFFVGSADAPGAYLLYNRARKDVQTLGFVNSVLKLKRLNPVKTIHYKARDGLDIAAILTLPAGKSTNLPLIVMPHGGPFARDSEEWDWWAQFLASRGYAVVQPNYRGSSGYGTEFAKKGEGQWGLAMQDDLNDAIPALAAQGVADPKRVCMVGASYGGYAAIRAAQRDGKLYRCAASFAGVSDMGAMIRYDRRFLNGGAAADWDRKQAPDLKAVSPINFVDEFSIPLLLMHGKIDQVVPVKQSRELAAKLKAAGKPVEYIEQPQGNHHMSRYEDRLQMLKAVEAFLAKYNPA